MLVAAGDGYTGYLRSAELYDPATASWSGTSGLGTLREYHTATLLSSGEVLVAGGAGGVNAGSSAELYDPATVIQITPAGTTCSQFSSGTAESLGSGQ